MVKVKITNVGQKIINHPFGNGDHTVTPIKIVIWRWFMAYYGIVLPTLLPYIAMARALTCAVQ